MNVVVRRPGAHEADAYASCLDASFGVRATNDERERFLAGLVDAHALGAFDGDELVGTCSVYDVDLTVPGPKVLNAAAIVDVGVLPTHRGQGVLRQLMGKAFEEMHDRASAVAILHASEGGIYGQFGFAPATFASRYRIGPRQGALAEQLAPDAKGVVRMLAIDDARSCLPAVFDATRQVGVGEIARRQPWWDELFDRPLVGDGPPQFFSCYESDGNIDGYLIYEIGSDPASPSHRGVRIIELCALSPGAYRSLFGFALRIDPDAALRTENRPIDEPVRFALVDPRALQAVAMTDCVRLRLIDVAGALRLRGYRMAAQLVIAVRDDKCGWNTGVFALSVAADGTAEVRPTTERPELSCAVADLAACYLGGVSFSTLAMSSSITEHEPGAIARADQVFGSPTAPFCSSVF